MNINYSVKIASLLRKNDINTDVYYLDKNLKQKFKYADKLCVKYVIVVGEEEESTNTLVIKDMMDGNQESIPLDEKEILKRII